MDLSLCRSLTEDTIKEETAEKKTHLSQWNLISYFPGITLQLLLSHYYGYKTFTCLNLSSLPPGSGSPLSRKEQDSLQHRKIINSVKIQIVPRLAFLPGSE